MSNAQKYTVEAYGPRIEQFLGELIAKAGLELEFAVTPGASLHPEIENPELMVKFTGPDLDMLLANRAELMLALEHLTLELLRVPSDEHSLLCFDANDYRLLRMEELRLSALAAAEASATSASSIERQKSPPPSIRTPAAAAAPSKTLSSDSDQP